VASASFQDTQRDALEQEGALEHCPVQPRFFRQEERRITGFIHGDDGAAIGYYEDLTWLEELLRKLFECRMKPIAGYHLENKETEILKMPIVCTEAGWTLEGNSRHADALVKAYDLDRPGTKGAATPGTSELSKMEEESEPLDDDRYAGFRSRAGLAQYIANHNLVLKYAVKQILRKASSPTEATDARLKRVARWLVDNRRLVMLYKWQEMPTELIIKTDSDYAEATMEGRSTTSVILQLRNWFLMGLSCTQPIEALSVAAASFYAEERGIVEGGFAQNVLEFYGYKVTLRLLADNSASRGILSRLGAGKKTRHIATKFFWVQRLVRDGLLKIGAIKGTENEADIGTKHLNRQQILTILAKLGMFLLPAKANAEIYEDYYGMDENELKLKNTAWRRSKGKTSQVVVAMQKLAGEYVGKNGSKQELDYTLVVLSILGGIGACVVIILMTKLMMWTYRKLRWGRRLAPLAALGVEELYQAPNRGKVHCDITCRRISHLTDLNRIKLSWCDDCRQKVEKAADKMKED